MVVHYGDAMCYASVGLLGVCYLYSLTNCSVSLHLLTWHTSFREHAILVTYFLCVLFVRQCCIFIMTRERTLPYYWRYKHISVRTRSHHNPNEQTPPPPPPHEADATQLHSVLNILESDSIVSLKPPASQGTQPQPSQNHKGRAGRRSGLGFREFEN